MRKLPEISAIFLHFQYDESIPALTETCFCRIEQTDLSGDRFHRRAALFAKRLQAGPFQIYSGTHWPV